MWKEQRALPRIPCDENIVFINIRHTFGTPKDTVYTVTDYHEKGLSFIVPADDGYFLPGTPLRVSLFSKVKHFRKIAEGIVRYYMPIHSSSGKKMYKIGMEYKPINNVEHQDKFKIRVQRFTKKDGSEQWITFQKNRKIWTFEIIDYSKYSVAFYIDKEDLIAFPLSSILDGTKIVIDSETVFEGTSVIFRAYQDASEKYRIVVQPRGCALNLDLLERSDSIKTADSSLKEIVQFHNGFKDLDTSFKSIVADIRIFLEDIKSTTEKPAIAVNSLSEDEIAKEFFPTFFEKLDSKMCQLDELVRELNLSRQAALPYEMYFRKHLHNLFLESTFQHRCYHKPSGYAGDYEMMRLNHVNSFDGPNLFSRLLNKYTTSCHLGEVGRLRTSYLVQYLQNFLKQSGNSTPRIFSIASGPCLELQELYKDGFKSDAQPHFTLLDQDAHALEYALDAVYGAMVASGVSAPIECINQTLQTYLSQSDNSNQKYDLIYSFGLFDYFDETIAKHVVANLIPLLKSKGKLVIANASLDRNKYRLLLEYCLDWYIVYRSRDELLKLGKEVNGGENCTVYEIGEGTMKFLEITQQ